MDALTVGEKSPPRTVQVGVLKNVYFQVASLVVAWIPSPSPFPVPPWEASEVPSPQSFFTRRNSTVSGPPAPALETLSLSIALLIVDPAGINERSNFNKPRRLFRPAI